MCGITGFWNFKHSLQIQAPKELIKKMADAISHRGPDSEGFWWDEVAKIYFGHRRLAVIDLTTAGSQPMFSASGLSVLSYNGEIYNSEELRKELKAAGCQFRGQSDTEVIVEACELWGVEKACQRLIGMFAFAFWDVKLQQLTLVRDRVGKKPLYWGIKDGVVLFASELKALTMHPAWSPKINRQALSAYFDYNYVPAPFSIYEDIQKLKPGRILTIDAKGNCKEKSYWDLLSIATAKLEGTANTKPKTDAELTDSLDILLKDAIKRRMIADVPLAAFLSGGIDSSLIVALMQTQSLSPIKTFSIGFNETGYNEAPYAKAVAKHLGTDHHELYLDFAEARSIIPSLPSFYDEPFADASQIPTFLVSKLARSQVTVSLSGDGGDELFAGYNRYLFGDKLWNILAKIPAPIRLLAEKGLLSLSPAGWDKLANTIPGLKQNAGRLGDKIHKLSGLFSAKNREEFYQLSVSHWGKQHDLVKQDGSFHINTIIRDNLDHKLAWNETETYKNFNFIQYMQYLDTLTYLPDDILTKVDRASMAVSLEARTPFLDHRVIEFAWSLPTQMKIRAGKSKWLLRSLLKRYVPDHLIERPKMGFAIPLDTWLRGPLRDWAENLLSLQELEKDDILNPALIRKRWEEHVSGKRNWQYALWGVLMFQAWRKQWA